MNKIIEFIGALDDGGAQTLVKDYAIMLNERNYETVIVSLFDVPNAANTRLAKEAGIRIIPIFSHYNIFTRVVRKYLGEKYIPWKLLKIIEDERPDCIHIHLALLRYCLPIRRFLKEIKLFYTCHTVPDRLFSGENESEFSAAQQLIKENNLQLIALHTEMQLDLNKRFGITNTKIIRNGIDFKRFKNVAEKRTEIRKNLKIDEDCLLLGHIGRFSEMKNHSFILDVFSTIKSRNIKAKLLLIGEGPLMNCIKDKGVKLGLQDSIIYLSRRTDIPQLLKAMDVFIFPSLYEGLSVTLVEAQVAGLRCVISDRINPETILSSRTIALSLDDSIEKWADYVLNVECYNDVYDDINKFDMNTEMEELIQLYDSL